MRKSHHMPRSQPDGDRFHIVSSCALVVWTSDTSVSMTSCSKTPTGNGHGDGAGGACAPLPVEPAPGAGLVWVGGIYPLLLTGIDEAARPRPPLVPNGPDERGLVLAGDARDDIPAAVDVVRVSQPQAGVVERADHADELLGLAHVHVVGADGDE